MSMEPGRYEKGMILFMGKGIKSYLVFTSAVYRMVMYILMPVGMVGLSAWSGSGVGEAALLIIAPLLTLFEILSDSWLFGGIQAKDREKMDFLKTSGRGSKTLKNALILDLVRRFLSCLGILAAGCLAIQICDAYVVSGNGVFPSNYVNLGGGSRKLGIMLCFSLVSYFFSVLGTFLSRYGSMIWINLLTGYLAMIPTIFCVAAMVLSESVWLYDFLFAVLGIGVSILAVRAAVKKNEGGYYDK